MQKITGTLIWYYYVCPREVWLMSHELNPNQEDPFIEIGRLIHEESYQRDRKEITVGDIKFDIVRKREGQFVVGEIKKSSNFELPARMQLLFYLYRLKRMGIDIKGELLIPKERKRIQVELDEEKEKEIREAIYKIKSLISEDIPPEPKKIKFCRRCAYREFCWV